jgi:hypothetical protein
MVMAGDKLKAYFGNIQTSEPLSQHIAEWKIDAEEQPVQAVLKEYLVQAFIRFEQALKDSGGAIKNDTVQAAYEEAAQVASWFVQPKGSREGKKGRPFSARVLAVKAIELRMTESPIPSYTKIAMKHCECDEATHGQKCGENIRHQVIALKKFLKARDIQVPGLDLTKVNP